MRLETERLILRPWREGDAPRLAAVIGDPEVRRYYPGIASLADAEAGIARSVGYLSMVGYGFLAVEHKASGGFVGLLGMAPFTDLVRNAIPGAPPVEIGWQFDKAYWGQGLAPEGARAVLDYAWRVIGLEEVVAITYRGNLPSQRVMEKIGMVRDPAGDFEHPNVPIGHRLRPHVLYRIKRPHPKVRVP